jgi:hypothetical protein
MASDFRNLPGVYPTMRSWKSIRKAAAVASDITTASAKQSNKALTEREAVMKSPARRGTLEHNFISFRPTLIGKRGDAAYRRHRVGNRWGRCKSCPTAVFGSPPSGSTPAAIT